MATGNGNEVSYTSSGYTFKWYTVVTYNITSTTDTTVNYSVTVGVYHNADSSKHVSLASGIATKLNIGGTQVSSTTTTSSHTIYGGETYQTLPLASSTTYTGSFTRSTVEQTIALSASVTLNNWGKGTSTYTNDSAFIVPAKALQVYTKVGGAIKTAKVYVKVNNTIYQPHTGYVKVDGVWKQIT